MTNTKKLFVSSVVQGKFKKDLHKAIKTLGQTTSQSDFELKLKAVVESIFKQYSGVKFSDSSNEQPIICSDLELEEALEAVFNEHKAQIKQFYNTYCYNNYAEIGYRYNIALSLLVSGLLVALLCFLLSAPLTLGIILGTIPVLFSYYNMILTITTGTFSTFEIKLKELNEIFSENLLLEQLASEPTLLVLAREMIEEQYSKHYKIEACIRKLRKMAQKGQPQEVLQVIEKIQQQNLHIDLKPFIKAIPGYLMETDNANVAPHSLYFFQSQAYRAIIQELLEHLGNDTVRAVLHELDKGDLLESIQQAESNLAMLFAKDNIVVLETLIDKANASEEGKEITSRLEKHLENSIAPGYSEIEKFTTVEEVEQELFSLVGSLTPNAEQAGGYTR